MGECKSVGRERVGGLAVGDATGDAGVGVDLIYGRESKVQFVGVH